LALLLHQKQSTIAKFSDVKTSRRMMAKRPTLKDLAGAAGVGVATVDRVLNGRL